MCACMIVIITHTSQTLQTQRVAVFIVVGFWSLPPPRHDNRSPRLADVITPSHSSYQITKQHFPRMPTGMFVVRGDLDVIQGP